MSLYELTLVLVENAKAITPPGKVKTTKEWGTRDLAYPIKKALRGGYFHFVVELEPSEVTSLDKSLRQNDQVLRYLLIRAKE